ncbi:hypothetical protein NTE_00126 [Candidatus Nitrososphaera evergladensis SR1]|jgi:hypothetical protein|uniref:Uncharacterized protein n=1 Tax=Candidatus Nitrososphaera evergladensis SR1 TaxID=1459636 RepID=A0A075MLQ3_9ARCH|nr:hypothetical protein [Candidatus Nitrososphaera evergladensis]AIF82208.1 hypothetical protein NTE_00126 [Candidatus Nitrososphaera evergladensis SR1]
MGLLTWIVIAVVIVLIIGIGVEAFFSGLISGAEKLGNNPVIKNATEEGKNFAKDAIQNATSGMVK